MSDHKQPDLIPKPKPTVKLKVECGEFAATLRRLANEHRKVFSIEARRSPSVYVIECEPPKEGA
jgi:hypothetical protein